MSKDNNDNKNESGSNDDNEKTDQPVPPPAAKDDKRPMGCEHASERRTVQFLVRRLGDAQDRMFDLMADMRTFEHYSEIEDVGWCLWLMQRLKAKYRKFAESGTWPE